MSQDERFRMETVTEWDKGKKGPFVCDAVGGTASEGRSVSVSFIALHLPLLHPPHPARDQSFNGQTFHEHLLCAALVPGMGEGRRETNAEGLACRFSMKTFSARLSLEHTAFLCSLEPLEHSQELLAEAGEVRGLVWEGRRPHPQ